MFSECSSIQDKINLVYQAIHSNDQFKNVKNTFPSAEDGIDEVISNAQKSKMLRDQGNKLYSSKNFVEAIKMYTESAISASINEGGESRELALALGNR